MEELKKLDDLFPDAELNCPIGYEDCVIGVCLDTSLLVLDATMIIKKIMEENGLSSDDAKEHFLYNIHGSKGKGYDAKYVMKEPL